MKIEETVKDVFSASKARFLFIKDNTVTVYDAQTGLKSQSEQSLALALQKDISIITLPDKEKAFNGSVDIQTSMPLILSKFTDRKDNLVGVLMFTQPSIKSDLKVDSFYTQTLKLLNDVFRVAFL